MNSNHEENHELALLSIFKVQIANQSDTFNDSCITFKDFRHAWPIIYSFDRMPMHLNLMIQNTYQIYYSSSAYKYQV